MKMIFRFKKAKINSYYVYGSLTGFKYKWLKSFEKCF